MPKQTEDAQKGKRVITKDGHAVGEVMAVEDGVFYIAPSSGLLAGYGSWLANTLKETDTYQLDEENVIAITPNEVILREGGLDLVDAPENRR